MSDADIEMRLRNAKARRDRLVTVRAEKLAAKKAAEERMSKLREKALQHGFELEDLESILEQKKRLLEEKVSQFEADLAKAESALKKFED